MNDFAALMECGRSDRSKEDGIEGVGDDLVGPVLVVVFVSEA